MIDIHDVELEIDLGYIIVVYIPVYFLVTISSFHHVITPLLFVVCVQLGLYIRPSVPALHLRILALSMCTAPSV